jgi:hypothetical protein
VTAQPAHTGINAPFVDTTGLIIEGVFVATGVILTRQAVDRYIEESISAYTPSPRQLPGAYVWAFAVEAITRDLIALLDADVDRVGQDAPRARLAAGPCASAA